MRQGIHMTRIRVCEVQSLTSARSISESPFESMGTMACLGHIRLQVVHIR